MCSLALFPVEALSSCAIPPRLPDISYDFTNTSDLKVGHTFTLSSERVLNTGKWEAKEMVLGSDTGEFFLNTGHLKADKIGLSYKSVRLYGVVDAQKSVEITCQECDLACARFMGPATIMVNGKVWSPGTKGEF